MLQIGTEAAIGQYVDRASEEFFEILFERDHVEQCATGLHFDEKIEIAVRSILT